MTIRQTLANEFLLLAVEELLDAGSEVTLVAQHQVLQDWLEVYEDVPPRNRAETAVRDALIRARDGVAKTLHEPQMSA